MTLEKIKGSVQIQPSTITENLLDIVNTPTDLYGLTYNSSSGSFKYEAVAILDKANTFTAIQKINVNSATALVVEQDGVKDNVLVVDTANGRVGIGIVSPSTLLHVHSIGATDGYITITDDGVNSTYGGRIRGYGVQAEGGYLGLGIINNNSYVQGITINPGGYVGIGVPSPSVILDVSGDIRMQGGAHSLLFNNGVTQISLAQVTNGFYFDSNVGIGVYATDTILLRMAKTFTNNSGTVFGIYSDPVLLPTADSTTGFIGNALYPVLGQNEYDISYVLGFMAQPFVKHTAGANVTYYVTSFMSSPYLSETSAGTIPELYGFYASDVSKHASSTETITTQFGMRIAAQTKGVANYAIFTDPPTPSFFGGKVGINTAPDYYLHVNASATAGAYNIGFIGTAGAARDILIVGQSGYSNGFTIQYDGSKMVYTFDDTSGITTFYGQVGLGCVPNVGLVAEIGSGGGVQYPVGLVIDRSTYSSGGETSYRASITIGSNAGSITNAGWQIGQDLNGLTGTKDFYIYDNNTNNTRIYIDTSGNFTCYGNGTFQGQIGTTGSSAGVLFSSRDGTGASFVFYNPTGDDLRLYAGGDLLTFTSGGVVLIGTTTDIGNAKLDVVTTANTMLRVRSTSAGDNWVSLDLIPAGAGNAWIEWGTTSGSNLAFASYKTGVTNPVVLIDADGNVGIGTVNTNGKLVVLKDSTYNNEVEGGIVITSNDTTSNAKLILGTVGNSYSYIQSMSQWESWTSRPLLLQPNGGYVGIGVTPSEKLHIRGTSPAVRIGDYSAAETWDNTLLARLDFGSHYDINITSRIGEIGNYLGGTYDPDLFIASTVSGVGLSYRLLFHHNGNNYCYQNFLIPSSILYTDKIYNYTGSTTPLTIGWTGDAGILFIRSDNDGRVGIGTSSPDYLLQLENATATMDLKSTTGTNYGVLYIENGSGTTIIGTERSTTGGLATSSTAYASIFGSQTNTNVQFMSNNAVRMTIDNAGLVGIGITSPAKKLHISNTIGLRGTGTNDGDVLGTISWDNTNDGSGYNVAWIEGITGSNVGYGEFIFNVRGAGGPAIALTLNEDGGVGIGGWNALGGSKLYINGSASASANINADTYFMVTSELGSPPTVGANQWALFARDNGAGKTQLCVQFNTGAVQVISTQP